jgi:diguanylate cyclase (GGDEF)-like protein
LPQEGADESLRKFLWSGFGVYMTLDVPTLCVMQSFGIAAAAAVLLFAWVQNRAVTVFAVWGLAHVVAAAGILGLMLGVALHEQLWSAVGGILLCTQSSLIWKAARDLDDRRTPFGMVFIGAAVMLAAGAVPLLRAVITTIGLTCAGVYNSAATISLWQGRSERLIARWALTAFVAEHSLALWIGMLSTLSGSTGQDAVPPIMSLFGFIYFESIVFAFGTALFVVMLIKERSEATILAAAQIDGLTGIANRTAFMDQAARSLARCRRHGAPIAAVMFDLDYFKSINDGHGHATGDAVLKKFCEVAAAALRPYDLMGRVGGEEFAIVMPGCSIEAAFARAERIRNGFADHCRSVADRQVNATVSGGVAVDEASAGTVEALLATSDAALYEAKAAGRNRVKRAKPGVSTKGASNVLRVA